MKARRSDQRGVVALTVTIIISIVMSIIVLSMVAIIGLVQHQAADNADSIRAYFAAEAGIEDGLFKLETSTPTTGSCVTAPSLTASSKATITCQEFNNQTTAYQSTLDENGTPAQIDLSGINFNSLVIKWNDQNRGDTSNYAVPLSVAFPNAGSWGYPAVLELITTQYPRGGSYTPDSPGGSTIATDVMVPAATGLGVSSWDAAAGTLPAAATCTATTPTNPYNCSMAVNGFTAGVDNYIIRLKALYSGTNFQIQVYGGGPPLSIPAQSETIDVTAQVGSAYSRLEEQLPLVPGTANLDYVLFADDAICKNLSVSHSIPGNPPTPETTYYLTDSCPAPF